LQIDKNNNAVVFSRTS